MGAGIATVNGLTPDLYRSRRGTALLGGEEPARPDPPPEPRVVGAITAPPAADQSSAPWQPARGVRGVPGAGLGAVPRMNTASRAREEVFRPVAERRGGKSTRAREAMIFIIGVRRRAVTALTCISRRYQGT